MIKLDFKVDPTYLVYYMLVNCSSAGFIPGVKSREAVVEFENLAWEKDREAYDFLRYGVNEDLIINKKSIIGIARRAENLLDELVEEKSFKPLLQETLDSLSKTREEWERDLPRTFEIMSQLTGLALDHEFEVYITHPSQKNGRGGQQIRWSYRQDFPHYNTIYMWHEILHTFLPRYSHELIVNVEHAVIELLSDEELRSRLNGIEYPPFVGHPELTDMKMKLLPSWRSYLKKSQKQIEDYLKQAYEILGQRR